MCNCAYIEYTSIDLFWYYSDFNKLFVDLFLLIFLLLVDYLSNVLSEKVQNFCLVKCENSFQVIKVVHSWAGHNLTMALEMMKCLEGSPHLDICLIKLYLLLNI